MSQVNRSLATHRAKKIIKEKKKKKTVFQKSGDVNSKIHLSQFVQIRHDPVILSLQPSTICSCTTNSETTKNPERCQASHDLRSKIVSEILISRKLAKARASSHQRKNKAVEKT